ncbi:hypothetical protein M407DRAFT_26372, partial [Tulasnella calospora MUT 4182]
MPPKRGPARSSGFVYCDHCDKVVSRQTSWRHHLEAQQTAALAANLQLPSAPQPPPDGFDSPPLGDISLTSTELALSDIHPSDLEDDDDDNVASLGAILQPLDPPSESESDEEMQELSMLCQDMQ